MDEKRAFMALSRLKGINRRAKRQIADLYPDISRILTPGSPDVNPQMAGIAARFHDWKGIDRHLKLCEELGVRIVTIRDNDYPPLLRQIPDAPLVLYVRGAFRPGPGMISIVGSRKASAEGMNLAGKIAETLSFAGITVISGLARGIDTAAHERALTGQGKTVAVLGCGIDVCYPPENKPLLEKIADQGLVVTEYPPGDMPLSFHFPERNRIIAGLGRGVLVIEAARRSGSLITARLGLEYGREVMAVPGSVLTTRHEGSNGLIKEGARLIESVEDVMLTCFPDMKLFAGKPVELDSSENKVYSLIGFEKVHTDEVIERSGMDIGDVMAVLTRLTIKNVISETPGGYFVRR
ncbi:MAG: DNA-processing protein DprA [Syntrophorhabdaceae bacterium]